MDKPPMGNQVGWAGKAWWDPSYDLTGMSMWRAGYDGDKQQNKDSQGRTLWQMWEGSGAFTWSSQYQIHYSADTWTGCSGGPVFSNDNYIIGTTTYRVDDLNGVCLYNGGVRMTQMLSDFINGCE
jgi:V8-like Glu-specific endopeptidase